MNAPLPSNPKVYDYLDHPPQRYSQWCSASHGHEMMASDKGAWVKFADMDMYMFEGGQLMIQEVAEIDRLRAALRHIANKDIGIADEDPHERAVWCAAWDMRALARQTLGGTPDETICGEKESE